MVKINELSIGQRWMSEAEPELGLGVLIEIQDKTLTIAFPASELSRRYGIKNPPLKRVIFKEQDEIKTIDGTPIIVSSTQLIDGVVFYEGVDQNGQSVTIHEEQLEDTLKFNTPLDKFFNGQISNSKSYSLRMDTLRFTKKIHLFPHRGFLGGRLSLIPHQYYVANKVLKSQNPRVLLADEVGLGKTIEAGLIMRKLIMTGRAEKVLIIVPSSLVHQWFVEMLRRFQLSFTVMDSLETFEKNQNHFENARFAIVGIQLLEKAPLAYQQALETKWDLVIVDEAHRLKWEDHTPGSHYKIVEKFAIQAPSLLLLTATPEQLGQEGHFARLRLLDPIRFSSFEQFKSDSEHFKQLSEIIKFTQSPKKADYESILKLLQKYNLSERYLDKPEELRRLLIDIHGTGRVYFRNTRAHIDKNFTFFPKRNFFPSPLRPDLSAKERWLLNFLNSTTEKVLLITTSKEEILLIEEYLKNNSNIKISLFHNGLGLMARDRQAAYFSDPKGSQVLLCTEMGSEGRNFEFAHHLVLFDLPQNPDLLEQRIGRLDRIGQKKDVNIHVPYFTDSQEEILLNWHHKGINAFEKNFSGAGKLFEICYDNLQATLHGDLPIENLLKFTLEKKEILEKELHDGRDYLIESNSYNEEASIQIIKSISNFEKENNLKKFMESIYSEFGLRVEDLDQDSFFLSPGDNMFISSFPCLNENGKSFTYNRSKALVREDLEYLSWDHPMVTETIDLILSEQFGSVSCVKTTSIPENTIFLEVIYILEAILPPKLGAEIFFPSTPIRTIVSFQGEDYSSKIKADQINSTSTPLQKQELEQLNQVPRKSFENAFHSSNTYAKNKMTPILQKYTEELNKYFSTEVKRIHLLEKNNPQNASLEINRLEKIKSALDQSFKEAALRPDSMRIMINF